MSELEQLKSRLNRWTNKLEEAKREGNSDMILLATRKIENLNKAINRQSE